MEGLGPRLLLLAQSFSSVYIIQEVLSTTYLIPNFSQMNMYDGIVFFLFRQQWEIEHGNKSKELSPVR